MDETPRSNTEVERIGMFESVNNYVLLFFAASCVLSNMYLQQAFFMIDQVRVGIGVGPLFGMIIPVYFLTR